MRSSILVPVRSSPSSVAFFAVGPCTALPIVGCVLRGRSLHGPLAIGCALRFRSVSYPLHRRPRSQWSVAVRSSQSSVVFSAVGRCSVLPIVGRVLRFRSVSYPWRRRVRSSISVRVLPSPSSAAFSVVCRCSVLPIVGCVLGGRSVPAPPRRRPRSSRSVAARPPRYRVRSQWSVAARPPRYRVRSQWSVAVRSSPSSAAFSVVGRCTAPSLSGAFSVVSRCSVLPIVGRVLSGRSLHGPTAVCGLPTLHWSRVHTRGWLSGWTPSVAARTHRWSSHVSEQSVRPSRYRLPWPPPGADAAVQPAPVCCHRI